MAVTGYTGGKELIPKKSIRSHYSKPSEKKPYIMADIKPFEKEQLRVDQDIWLPPSTGDTPNWNIVGDNRIKKVFKIEVGNIPDEEIEDYIKKVAEKFKAVVRPMPDLDCGIYPNVYHENELFLLTNIEKKMPEQPDLQKIHDALYPKNSAHYMHVIPNSHFWTDLSQITYSIQHELERQKREAEVKDNNSIYIGEPLTRDYILIGLGNSLMRGYNLKQDKNVKLNPSDFIIFQSIEDMIVYAQSERFNLEGFSSIISNTINVGFNLTNGIKMEREHVYKRIDGERNYQDIVGKSGQRGDIPDEEKPVAEWLNYIEYHLSKAKDCNYHLRKDNALEELRKVTALAVRAMEIHGCPERRMPNRIGNITINPDGTTTSCDNNCDCKK
ncbi:MAG: hypothetical protein WC428_01595 [Candidatus Paceibacterota bacterium]